MSVLTPEQEARVREIVAEVLLEAVREYLWRERADIRQRAAVAVHEVVNRGNGEESYLRWAKERADD